MSDRVRAAIQQFVDRAYAALDQTDYYRVLGVSSAATEREVRDSYYKLAARLHPDIHGDGLEAEFRGRLTTVFSRVVEAYKVLSDRRKRADYDAALAQGMLRMTAGLRVKPRAEEAIADPNARKFYLLAQKQIADGDGRSALMNLRIAMSSEPDNPVLREAVTRAEGLVRGGGSRGT